MVSDFIFSAYPNIPGFIKGAWSYVALFVWHFLQSMNNIHFVFSTKEYCVAMAVVNSCYVVQRHWGKTPRKNVPPRTIKRTVSYSTAQSCSPWPVFSCHTLIRICSVERKGDKLMLAEIKGTRFPWSKYVWFMRHSTTSLIIRHYKTQNNVNIFKYRLYQRQLTVRVIIVLVTHVPTSA